MPLQFAGNLVLAPAAVAHDELDAAIDWRTQFDIALDSVVDEVMTVSDQDAMLAGRYLSSRGLLVGISSGAAFSAACSLAKKEEYSGKTIVALLPDTGERYLSTALFAF